MLKAFVSAQYVFKPESAEGATGYVSVTNNEAEIEYLSAENKLAQLKGIYNQTNETSMVDCALIIHSDGSCSLERVCGAITGLKRERGVEFSYETSDL